MAIGNSADVLDIAAHDTYFVIDGFQAGLIGTLLFAVLWSLHTFIPACRTVTWLSAVHLLTTSVVGLWLWAAVLLPTSDKPWRYSDYSAYDEFPNAQPEMDLTLLISVLVLMLAVLQLIFPVQVGIWIARKRKGV